MTEAPREESLGVEERLAALEAERDEYLNDLKRVAAEFENYRKRVLGRPPAHVGRAPHRRRPEQEPLHHPHTPARPPPPAPPPPRHGTEALRGVERAERDPRFGFGRECGARSAVLLRRDRSALGLIRAAATVPRRRRPPGVVT